MSFTDASGSTGATGPTAPTQPALGDEMITVMAALSAAAAVIHFGFAPVHLAEDWAHGWFFLAIAWFQISWAVVAYRRGTRGVLAVGAVVNAAIIAVWVVSRTVGLPFGPGKGVAEAVGFPDVVATLFEGVIVAGALALATAPTLGARRIASVRLAASATSAIAAVALFTGTLALTPSLAGEHATSHHGHARTLASGTTTGAAHDHGTGATAVGASTASGTHAAHSAAGSPWTGNSPCEEAGSVDGTETSAKGSSAEGHDHHGATPQKAIDAATMDKLAAQQAKARVVVTKFPTVADAEAAGYKKSTVYLPCIGAHYTNVGFVGHFDPSTPSELLYDGTAPDSKIVGLSYLIASSGHPEGFAGPNDLWHQHNLNGGLCLNAAGVVIGGEKMSKPACEKINGHKVGLDNIWMLHDWVVPGWECTWGVFAGQCPELGGKVGGSAF